MLKAKSLSVVLRSIQTREVSRVDGEIRHHVRAKFEAEDVAPGLVPFATSAVEEALEESRGREGDDGPNTYSIKAKVPLAVGTYSIRLLGGDSEERAESALGEIGAILEAETDPVEALAKVRRIAGATGREVRFSGTTWGKPEARIVEGALSLVWSVETVVSPADAASLAGMIHSEDVTLDVESVQVELDFGGGYDEDAA